MGGAEWGATSVGSAEFSGMELGGGRKGEGAYSGELIRTGVGEEKDMEESSASSSPRESTGGASSSISAFR